MNHPFDPRLLMVVAAGILIAQAWTFLAGNRCAEWEINRPHFLILAGPFVVAFVTGCTFLAGLIEFIRGLHYSP